MPPAAPQRIGNSLRLRILTGPEPPWVPHRAHWAWPGSPGPVGLPPWGAKGAPMGGQLLRLAFRSPLNRGDQKWELPICAEDHQRRLGSGWVGRDVGRT